MIFWFRDVYTWISGAEYLEQDSLQAKKLIWILIYSFIWHEISILKSKIEFDHLEAILIQIQISRYGHPKSKYYYTYRNISIFWYVTSIQVSRSRCPGIDNLDPVNNPFFDKNFYGIVAVVSFYGKNKDFNFHLAEFCFFSP